MPVEFLGAVAVGVAFEVSVLLSFTAVSVVGVGAYFFAGRVGEVADVALRVVVVVEAFAVGLGHVDDAADTAGRAYGSGVGFFHRTVFVRLNYNIVSIVKIFSCDFFADYRKPAVGFCFYRSNALAIAVVGKRGLGDALFIGTTAIL